LQNSIKSKNLGHCILAVVQPRNNEMAMKLFHGFYDYNPEKKLDFPMNSGPVRGKAVLHFSFNTCASCKGLTR
jgi:hypothetical protein